jgi:hypothetical protein
MPRGMCERKIAPVSSSPALTIALALQTVITPLSYYSTTSEKEKKRKRRAPNDRVKISIYRRPVPSSGCILVLNGLQVCNLPCVRTKPCL